MNFISLDVNDDLEVLLKQFYLKLDNRLINLFSRQENL